MGYTTDFWGEFTLDKPLTHEQVMYLEAFAKTRRMKRNEFLTAKRDDPVREAVGLPVGQDGAYFVGSPNNFGQEHSEDVVEYNYPPAGQPSLWCQWVPTEDGTSIEWDGGEKFYDYVEWIEYIIVNFLIPWGYKLNGKVGYQGEESNDRGVIRITDNVVECAEDRITNPLD